MHACMHDHIFVPAQTMQPFFKVSHLIITQIQSCFLIEIDQLDGTGSDNTSFDSNIES